jgi:diguanylate cyclase (GGDEF)-like protein
MRVLIEKRVFAPAQAGQKLSINVSIGVATFPADGMTPADLISRADAALYYAKKHGKNCVAMAADIVSAEAM